MTPSAATQPTTWHVYTRFGPFEAGRDDVIAFPDGLPGFEACHRFVLINSEAMAPLKCLQAVEAPYPSFLAIEPKLVDPDYALALGQNDRARLGINGTDLVLQLVIVVAREDGASVNLRAPVVINTANMTGCQVIPESSPYSVNQPLDLG